MSSAPRTLAEKIWDAHVVRSASGEPDLLYIDLHLVHEVTSPQAFDGLRAAGRKVRRPDLTIATEDHNVPTTGITGPGVPLSGPGFARHRSRLPGPGGGAAEERRRVRRPAAPDGRRRPGHRARHRPAARGDAAGHDHRLRRLAHVDPRRVRRAGLRHRHQRGRARPRDPDAAADQAEDDGRQRGRRAAGRRHGQGPDPRDHRADRHRRRPGLRHRVPRRGHPVAVHGRPSHGLQHVHRGRGAGRADRPGRSDVRVPQGPPARPVRGRLGDGARLLALPAHRRGREVRPRSHGRRRRADSLRDLGDQPRSGAAARRLGAGPDVHTGPGHRVAGAGVHGPDARAPRCATSPWTRCSSAPAPTGGSRTCAPPRRCSAAAASPPVSGCWSSPVPCRYAPRPRPRA